MEGNITATVYSLESSGDNSSEIVVTVVTNSDASPDTLTDLLTQPLDQELQEFADIDQNVLFMIIGTERFGMLLNLHLSVVTYVYTVYTEWDSQDQCNDILDLEKFAAEQISLVANNACL